MMAAAEAAARSRPSLLGDLPGYARQQPITLLGSAAGTAAAAASALAAPQISGTGASLLHAAAGQHSLLTAAAAAAAAAAAVKPHVVIVSADFILFSNSGFPRTSETSRGCETSTCQGCQSEL